MLTFVKRHAAAALVVALVVGGGGAVAYAATDSTHPAAPAVASATPTTTTPTTPAPARSHKGKGGGLGGVLNRAIHGEVVVKSKGGGFETVTFDRGKVTGSTATSVTVQRADGVSVTLTLGSATRYVGITAASQLVKGSPAEVLSRSGAAVAVAQRVTTATGA